MGYLDGNISKNIGHQCKNKWNTMRKKYKIENDVQNIIDKVKSKRFYFDKTKNIIRLLLKILELLNSIDISQPLDLQSKKNWRKIPLI